MRTGSTLGRRSPSRRRAVRGRGFWGSRATGACSRPRRLMIRGRGRGGLGRCRVMRTVLISGKDWLGGRFSCYCRHGIWRNGKNEAFPLMGSGFTRIVHRIARSSCDGPEWFGQPIYLTYPFMNQFRLAGPPPTRPASEEPKVPRRTDQQRPRRSVVPVDKVKHRTAPRRRARLSKPVPMHEHTGQPLSATRSGRLDPNCTAPCMTLELPTSPNILDCARSSWIFLLPILLELEYLVGAPGRLA